MSFRTQAPELLQQTAAENAERQVDLEEAGAFIFFISFDWNGETPLHGMACCTGKSDDLYTTEFPICLANHEARARTHQTEEKYKELQVGQSVECCSSTGTRRILISPCQLILE